MLRSSPVRLGLALVLGWALAGLPQAAAQEAKKANEKTAKDKDKDADKDKEKAKPGESEKVSFETVDEVKLVGRFYPSERGKKSPCVILLHQLGSDSKQDGWDRLAQELQKSGFAVLAFDFRGHGSSTDVSPGFWNNRSNQGLRGYSAAKPKQSISYKDFPNPYYVRLVDDIMAAKVFLDKKNDAEECNSSSLILVGAEEGATLGALWMGSEFNRHRITTPAFVITRNNVDPKPEGKNLTAAVWLTISPRLRGQSVAGLSDSLRTVGRENKVPMAFLFGAKDSSGESFAKHCEDELKKGNAKLELTAKRAVPETKLTGSGLLGESLETVKNISTYLGKVIKEKGPGDWEKRETDRTGFVWMTGSQMIVAKREGEKALQPLPPQLLRP